MPRVQVYLKDERREKVEKIMSDEHRGSLSNTVDALLAEAIEAREVREKRAARKAS